MMKAPEKQQNKETATAHIGSLMVNLLPTEILRERRQSSKLALVNKLSITALVALIFCASATLGLRISQNFNMKRAEQNLVYAQEKVSDLQDKERAVVVLKQRLSLIKSLVGADSKITAIFNMVVYLTPLDIQVTEASVDKNGNMVITLVTSSFSSLETLIDNLGNKEKNSDLISKVDLQGLSMGRDAAYRLVLKISPKK